MEVDHDCDGPEEENSMTRAQAVQCIMQDCDGSAEWWQSEHKRELQAFGRAVGIFKHYTAKQLENVQVSSGKKWDHKFQGEAYLFEGWTPLGIDASGDPVPAPAEEVACVPNPPPVFSLNEPGNPICTHCGQYVFDHGVDDAGNVLCPSPAEPVRVLPFTLPLSLTVEDGDVEIRDALSSLVLLVSEDALSPNRAEAIVTACNSHAAHLAKIQRLETALKNLMMWSERIPEPVGRQLRNDLAADRDAARAALA